MLIYLPTGRRELNVKALVGAFNQEKALVGAFSVIVKTRCGTDGALHSTSAHCPHCSTSSWGGQTSTSTSHYSQWSRAENGPFQYSVALDLNKDQAEARDGGVEGQPGVGVHPGAGAQDGGVARGLLRLHQVQWSQNISAFVRSPVLSKGKIGTWFLHQLFPSRGLWMWIIFSSITIWKGSDYLQSLAQYSFQDIPIAIPAPLNTIPDQILPSHIVVPRCHGNGRQTSQLSSNISHWIKMYFGIFILNLLLHHASIKQS